MPAISKIRFTNLVYENGAKRYRDEIFRFDSHNGVILLENGGGKTVLVQALLQVVLPHAALAERKAKDTFSLENSPAHIAVEWIINEKPRRYALTVVTLFSSKEGLDSYKYVYEYESGDKNSLEGLPLVRQGSDGRLRPASKAEMYDYYLAMSRSSMNAHYFPSIREYQQYIEENFKIIISEWRSIARINSAEGEVEGFFEGCKTTAQLVDRLLIPIVEEAMAGSGSQDFVETFQKQREHFKKHSQLQERIEESQKANSQIGHYVDAFASYHQAGQKMDNVRGQAKSLYRLALKEEQRVAQSMEHHQEASQSCQEQRQELDRKWASYELAQLELSMNQARQLWQQRQEEWQAQLEDYRNQHRRLQNLKLAKLRDGIRVQTESINLHQKQLDDLQADASVQALVRRVQQVEAGLRYCYLREEGELQSQEQQILSQERQLKRDIGNINRRYEQCQTEIQKLRIKEAQAQTQLELAEKEMQEIARSILDNYQHDEVAQEKERWEQRTALLEKDRQSSETELQQLNQERTALLEQLPILRQQLQAVIREEEKLQHHINNVEEQQQQLLLHLQEMYPEFSTINSLYLYQNRISEHITIQLETLRDYKERALLKDSQAWALFALYEPSTYYGADPQVERWIEEEREHFSYLEAGTLFVQKAAEQRNREEIDYFWVYPFWAITLVCRASEADRLVNRLAKYQKEMTHPLFIITTEEARQVIDQVERPEEHSPELKRQVFPLGWESNLAQPVFENWKKGLQDTAEQLRQARLHREAQLQSLQEYWRQVQDFWHQFPYEQYNEWRDQLRTAGEKVIRLDQSVRAQETREQEISVRIALLQKRLQDIGEEINHLSHRLREAQKYLRKAAEKERLRIDIEQDEQLIRASSMDLKRWEKERSRLQEQLGNCQQHLRIVQLQIDNLRNEELYKQVQNCPPQPTDTPRPVLTRQRQDLQDNLRDKQQGRQLLEERLQTARQVKEQLELELSRSIKECEYEIDHQLAFPPGGELEIDLLLPQVQTGKAKLDELKARLDKADRDYRVKEARFKDQEEEFLRDYNERVIFTQPLGLVRQQLQHESEALQQQEAYLREQLLRLTQEDNLTKRARNLLEQANWRYDFLPEAVNECELPAAVEQEFPYRPMQVIERYVRGLQEQQEELNHHIERLEQEKNRLHIFCEQEISDPKLRKMVIAGLSYQEYQEVWSWKTHMTERIAYTVRLYEDDLREHDRELQQFINHLHGYLVTLAGELRLIPRKTRVKVEEGWKEVFIFDVPSWEEREGKARLQSYVDWIIHRIESQQYRDEFGNEDYALIHKELQKWLQSQQLLRIVMNDKSIKVKCRKVTADGKVSSYPNSWESSNHWSGGEKWSKNMALFLGLLNYLAEKRQAVDSRAQRSRTVILDNPFGKASSDHVLDPVFFIAEQLGFQIIALTALAEGKFVREYFPVVYSCRLRPTSNEDKYLVTTEQEIREAYFQDHAPESLRRLGDTQQIELFQ